MKHAQQAITARSAIGAIGAIGAIAAIAAIAVALSGCSPRATITVDGRKAAFDSDMTPTAEKTVRRFTGADAGLFDRAKITASLEKAGFTVDQVEFPKQSSLSIRASVAGLDGLFAGAVSYAPGGKKLTVTITREALNAAADSLSPDMRDYVELLMAPAFTGETLSESEYLDVIRAAYGNTLAGELEKSRCALSVECPAPPKALVARAPVSAAKAGNRASFAIPLVTLLALEKPIVVSVEW